MRYLLYVSIRLRIIVAILKIPLCIKILWYFFFLVVRYDRFVFPILI